MKTWVFDTEVFVNCTLLCAESIDTRERFSLWRGEPNSVSKLRQFIASGVFIGFNSNYYDDVIVNAWCAGKSELELKNISNRLIEQGLRPWQALNSIPFKSFKSIDIMGSAPGFVGLKALGARLCMPVLQDLPYEHDKELELEQMLKLRDYCWNDVETTRELVKSLEDQLLLRVRMSADYGMDLRSLSDAQLAERTLKSVLGIEKANNKVPATVRYTPPAYLKFDDENLSNILNKASEYDFQVLDNGHVTLPEFMGSAPIEFGSGRYQLGVGGIHSTHDKSVCHVVNGSYIIKDIDAASFYPSMIIQNNFVPAGLGQRFVDEFRKIYERRLEAKRAGDKNTDSSLKVTINSVFGQFGNKYSVLYAPDLMLAVTLTGQFTLLMLIEKLERAGVDILSANTDGIAVGYSVELEEEVQRIVTEFEQTSKINFEYTPYRVLAMKDVNNYFAVKLDRKIKAKGIYAEPSLKKNLTASVCATAVGQWLAYGTPFTETISRAGFRDFLSARNVTGGGEQNGEYLGKVVRWYMSNDKSLPPLKYAKNGNKVPKTDGARACMVLPEETPADLDYDWYHKEAIRIAKDVGCERFLSTEELELIAKPKKERKRKNATK